MGKENVRKKTEHYVTEYFKCKNSFIHYCKNYVYLELPGKDELFTPYIPQENLIDKLVLEKFILVLKSRQIGISTIIQAYISWLVKFHNNVVVGIISKDAPEATEFARVIMSMLDKLPKWLAPKYKKQTERTFILSNGSKCYVSPVAPNTPEKTLRGKAITFLVIDEAAFINYLDTAWTAMVPALSTNQMMAKKNNIPYGTIILSTPNKTVGVGKWFYQKYVNAVSGDSLFKPFTIHWRDIKELVDNPDWYNTQCKLFDNDNKKIQQELELKFVGTQGTFFEEQTIESLQNCSIEPIHKYKVFNGEVWIFEKPVQGRSYLIAVDTAPEHGEDKSAISVWDFQDFTQVWEYQAKCKVQDFTKVVKVACSQYPGVCIIESNSYGNQVIEEMNSSDFYPMIYSETRGDKKIPGLATTSKTRPLMIDSLYSFITQYPESVKSKRLALELIGLVSKPSGRVEADTGSYDDIALTTAMASYVRKYDPPLMLEPKQINDSAFSSIIGMNQDIFGGEMTTQNVGNFVKNNLNEMGGFVNILSLYERG